MKLIANLINKIQFSRLKRTKDSRQVLRAQKVIVDGRTMNVMDWIDKEAARLPRMINKRQEVVHEYRARKFYYTYGLAGANYYFKAMWRIIGPLLNKANKSNI
jgi:hypothetical protein